MYSNQNTIHLVSADKSLMKHLNIILHVCEYIINPTHLTDEESKKQKIIYGDQLDF